MNKMYQQLVRILDKFDHLLGHPNPRLCNWIVDEWERCGLPVEYIRPEDEYPEYNQPLYEGPNEYYGVAE